MRPRRRQIFFPPFDRASRAQLYHRCRFFISVGLSDLVGLLWGHLSFSSSSPATCLPPPMTTTTRRLLLPKWKLQHHLHDPLPSRNFFPYSPFPTLGIIFLLCLRCKLFATEHGLSYFAFMSTLTRPCIIFCLQTTSLYYMSLIPLMANEPP